MFMQARKTTPLAMGLQILELIYHATVAKVRKSHGNALIGLGIEILQTVIFVVAFYLMFTVLGMKGNAIRGDFLLYLMTGIFLFLTHTKAMGALLSSEGPAAPMMKHAPMNTIISICSSALSSLYLQTLSMMVVMFGIHTLFNPLVIYDPISAWLMFLLAWSSGVGIGMCLLAFKPWAPNFVMILNTVYARLNMIASGKMFVANTLPGFMIGWFEWNPLFHAIDQARGYTFINYEPHFTNWQYALYFTVALVLLGLMGDFFTRRHASMSWSAGR
jgi:ABC-type polysaccharide/polyol phosphate export permease